MKLILLRHQPIERAAMFRTIFYSQQALRRMLAAEGNRWLDVDDDPYQVDDKRSGKCTIGMRSIKVGGKNGERLTYLGVLDAMQGLWDVLYLGKNSRFEDRLKAMVSSSWPDIHPVTASDLKSYVNQNRDHALALLQSVAESDGRGPTIDMPRGPLLVFITNVIGMCNIAPSQAGDQNSVKTLGSVDAKLTAFHDFIRDSRITCRMCGNCSDEKVVVPQAGTHVQQEISQSDGVLQPGDGASHIKDANHEQQIKPQNSSNQRIQNEVLHQNTVAAKSTPVNPGTDRNAKESSIRQSVVESVMSTSQAEGHGHYATGNHNKSANKTPAADQSMPSNGGKQADRAGCTIQSKGIDQKKICVHSAFTGGDVHISEEEDTNSDDDDSEEDDSEDDDDDDTEGDSSVDESSVQTRDANQEQDTSIEDNDEGSEESASTDGDSYSASTEEDEEVTTPDTSMSDPIDVSHEVPARLRPPKQPKQAADATSSTPLPPTAGNKGREGRPDDGLRQNT
ncbi:MAG: hypothetical protein Q9213_008429 [Squamulea squamosa]